MLRRATIGLKWVALCALIVGAFTYAVAKGGCGDCITYRVRMCDESVCGPYPACSGSCECHEWNYRYCASGTSNFCEGIHTGNVPVMVYAGYCDVSTSRPTCLCTNTFPTGRQLIPKDVCTPCSRP
jgi:hypothetical protein